MAKGFQLTAELNLRGPSNIRQVVGGIRKQLQGINTNLNININKKNIQGMQQANTRLAAINKTLQTTVKSANNATAAFNKLSASMRSVGNVKVSPNIASGMTNTTKSVVTTTKAVQQAKNEFEEFGKLGGLAIKRFAAFSVVTGAIYAVNNAISAGVKSFLEYDRQLTRVSQVLDTSRASLKGLDQSITALSTSLGVSSTELANVTVTLSQAGIQAADTRKALEALAKSALAPTFASLTNTTEGAIAAMRQFSISAGQLEGALGSINAVAGKFAVEASDIITAIQRTGGVFASASKGVSQGTAALNEFIAVFTSVRATSRESAETIATGLRTIFTRLQRQDTIDALKQFGVTLTDLEGKFVGPYKAIQLLSEGLRSLDTRDLKFAGIAEELGGFRQIGKVLPLIQQFGTAQQALNVAQGGSGSLAKDAAKGQLALAVQIQKVREEFTALVRSISDSTGFRTLLTVGLDLSRVFIGVADALKGVLPLLAGLGAMKGLSALAGFTKGFGGVFKKAEGGYIHKFARGGTVPGTGSGDTVPAMLQPGEFVIRKKAVETLGTKRLHKMNKFGNGGKNKKTKKDFQNIEATGGVHFTHLDGGRTGLPKELGIRKVYTNMGLDLPASWNLNWAKPKKDGKGATGKRLANYIKGNSVFSTLLQSGTGTKPYGFEGRSKSEAYDLLNKNRVKLRQNLAKKINKNSKFDTDADVISKLPSYLSSAIKQTVGKDAKKLQEGFEQESAYVKEGKAGRRRLSKRRKDQLPPRAEFASGGSVQDTVPAMLTPGEFVINKSSASKLGTRTLNKLNNADRIKGYNRGGVVGFANGGSAPARPGSTFDTIGISRNDLTLISAVGDEIQELGIASSSAAALIESGQQVTYQSALEALEADKFRAKSIGASTKSIDANIKALKKQAEGAKKVSQALKGATGEQLQNLSNRLDRGQKVGRAATRSGLGGVAALARSGDIETKDIQAYIAQASRDRKTLNQMDKFQINERKNYHLKQNKSLKDATRLAKQEVAERRKIVDQVARSQGAKGPGDFGRGLGKISNQLGIGVSLLSSAASSLSEATTAGGAATNAAIQGGGLAFGAGQIATGAAVDLLPDKFKALGAGLGLAASAALAVGQAFIDASNAARQFKIDKAFKESNKAMDDVNESFKEFEKDINNVNIKDSIETKLIEAGNAVARGIDIQTNQAKIFWTNAIDTILSAGSQESVQRAQILESQGFFAYMKSVFDSNFRETSIADQADVRVNDIVKQNKPIADGTLKLFEQQLRGGASLDDILGGAKFKQLSNSLALADAAVAAQVDAIQTNTILTKAEKDERINHIKSIAAEEAVRKRAAIVAREKEIQALERSTSIYTRSLERMFRNMEQSINKAAAALDKMNQRIDSNIAAMQGSAKVGNSSLNDITVLQNPRAFSSAENRGAAQRGASAFGNQAANVADLVNLGEAIERTVMSSVNSVLEANPNSTNAAVERDIAKSVESSLSDLGLPPELADKMASEVNRALQELSSEGQDSVDYSKLAEKLGNLNSVIETSKRAREVVVKLLQHQQKAISSYTSNLNKIIDIEMRSRKNARKSVDILANGELELAKSLSKTINIVDLINSREANIKRQTGGLSSVNDIFNRINELAAKRATEQGAADTAADFGDMDAFTKFSNSVKNTSIQLNENIAALKDLANNGEVAAAALNKIQEAQQTNAQKVGFFEKVVTSTPDQLEGMNRAFIRLQRNLNGQVNTINQSVGAQKAYFDALKSGASQFEAMRAAQGAFAQERGESLSLLKDIMPFLGDSEQSGGIRATALESMLRESGVGVNPMMQQVLNNLRNPQVDPAVQAAIKQYNEANTLQSVANKSLANLDAHLANNVAAQNQQAFQRALRAVPMTFDNQELKEISAEVTTIRTILSEQRGDPAPGFARGGVIYAAGGQQIFQPKGTDTVPAMLTPGEFVVNKSATQANLPLLKNINSGYYAAGGLVTRWNSGQPITEDSAVNSESKIDLPTAEFLQNAMNAQKGLYQRLPKAYFSQINNSIQSPRSTYDRFSYSSMGDDHNLKVLKADGDRQLGYTADIGPAGGSTGEPVQTLGTGRVLVYENLQKNQAEYQRSFPTADPDPVMLDKDLKTGVEKLALSQYDEYDKLYNEYEKNKPIFWTPWNRAPYADLSSVPHRERSDTNRFSTNATSGKHFGYYKGTLAETKANDSKLYNIYKSQTVGMVEPQIDAVSVGQPTFGGVLQDHRFRKSTISGVEIDTTNDNVMMGQDANTLAREAKESYDMLQIASHNWPLDRATDFRKSGVSSSAGLYKKLLNLMENKSQFEELDTSELSGLNNASAAFFGGPKLGNLVIANNAKLEQDIINKGKELQALLAAQPDAYTDDMGRFGSSAFNADTKYIKSSPFDLSQGAASKQFSWAANIKASQISEKFKQAVDEAEKAKQGTDGVNTVSNVGPNDIKLPYDGFGLDLVTQYQKYVGKFYDPKEFDFAEAFTAFIPTKGSESDKRHLFSNAPGPGELFQIGLGAALKPGDIKRGLSIRAGDITKYRNSLASGGDDDILRGTVENATLSLGPLLQRLQTSEPGIAKYVSSLNQEREFGVGNQLVESIKKTVDLEGTAAGKIAQDDVFKQGDLDQQILPRVVKSLTKSGLQLFGKHNFVRGVSQFLGRSIGGIPRNDNIDPVRAAAMAANAFGQVGGAANAAFGRAGNSGIAQYIKSAYILASGAWQAFSGLRDGDTALINDFVQASGGTGEIPVGYAEGLFRSLGAGSALDAVKNFKLPQDLVGQLDQAKEGQIAQIGGDGSISYKPMTDALPTDVASLMDFIFNPYNEFPTRSARTNIMSSFQKNLNNLKDPSGRRPFFDNQTSAFMNEGVNRLKTWYGGDEGSQRLANDAFRGVGNFGGFWPGHDLLHTDGKTPENAKALFDMFGNSNYAAASEANAAFGITNKFGPLPDASWFLARGRAAAVEPAQKARGGMIYASEGQYINFQPKGTDTVPAMLTPGEFVVNRQATQANLPLLQSINRSQGGEVSYFNEGGEARKKRQEEFKARQQAMNKRREEARERAQMPAKERVAHYKTDKGQEAKRSYIQNSAQSKKQGVENVAKYDAYVAERNQKSKAIEENPPYPGAETDEKRQYMVNRGQDTSKYDAYHRQKAIDAGKEWKGHSKAKGTSDKPFIVTQDNLTSGMEAAQNIGSSLLSSFKDIATKATTYEDPIIADYKSMKPGDEGYVKLRDRAGYQELPNSKKYGGKYDGIQKAEADYLLDQTRKSQEKRDKERAEQRKRDEEYKESRKRRLQELREKNENDKVRTQMQLTRSRQELDKYKKMDEEREYAYDTVIGRPLNFIGGVSDMLVGGVSTAFTGAIAGVTNITDAAVGVADKHITGPMGITDGDGKNTFLTPLAQKTTELFETQATRVQRGAASLASSVMSDKENKMMGMKDTISNLTDKMEQQELDYLGDSSGISRGVYNVANVAKEVAFDPLTYTGVGVATKGTKYAKEVAKFNKAATAVQKTKQKRILDVFVREAREAGYTSDEIAGAITSARLEPSGGLVVQPQDLAIRLGEKIDKRLGTPFAGSAARKKRFASKRGSFGEASLRAQQQPNILEGIKASKIEKAKNAQAASELRMIERLDRYGALDPDVQSSVSRAWKKNSKGVTDPKLRVQIRDDVLAQGEKAQGLTKAERAKVKMDFKKQKANEEFRMQNYSDDAVGGFARGGLIYANEGMMIPRGTDTVPAMLTPGEFVVNRQASQKNLGLLKSINSGVSYFKNGGEADEEKMGKYDQGQADKKRADEEAKAKKRQHEDHKKLAGDRAKDIAREQQIPLQQAYQQALQEVNSSSSGESGGAASTGVQRSQSQANQQQQIPQISRQQQAVTAQASQAAFDPKNSGDVNKQLAIFGQVLTGVNQVLVQYGTVLQSLLAVQQQQTPGGGGGQGEGENGGVSNGNGIAEYTQKFGEFVNSLKDINIPEQITLTGTHEVNVNVAGGKELTQAMQGPMGDYIIGRVNKGLASWVTQNFDDVSDPEIK